MEKRGASSSLLLIGVLYSIFDGPELLSVQSLVHCWESVSDGLLFYEKLPVFYCLSFVLRMEGLVWLTLQ